MNWERNVKLKIFFFFYNIILENLLDEQLFSSNKSSSEVQNYDRAQRIQGGKEIPIADAPYMAAFVQGNTYICSGSTVSQRFVVTAAQCFYL